MPTSPFGGFGAVERETEIVTSPMRSQAPKRKRRAKKKPAYLEEKAAPNPEMIKKSLERMFEEKIASLDDDVLDTLFPTVTTRQ